MSDAGKNVLLSTVFNPVLNKHGGQSFNGQSLSVGSLNISGKTKNGFVKHRNVVSQLKTIEFMGFLKIYLQKNKNTCLQRQQ